MTKTNFNINKDLEEFLETVDNDYKTEFEELFYGVEFKNPEDVLNYIDDEYDGVYYTDILSEVADRNVSIYNYDLFKWASDIDNVEYIERVVTEFGIDTKDYNYTKHLQIAQYLEIQDNLYELSYEFREFFVNKYPETEI